MVLVQSGSCRGERLGVLAAILSSSLGGVTTAATRYVIGAIDPVTLAGLRFGTGFLLLLPIALLLRSRWPKGRDWLAVALLGILFFGVFQAIYNLSFRYTAAARGALALSTLPLITMLAGAALGVERLTRRKSTGVLIAILGVAVALATGLKDAPDGAWRGDAIMVAGACCFAFYNVWSRPFIARSSAMGFVTVGMGFGALAASLVAAAGGGFANIAHFGTGQWISVIYVSTLGAALTFFLWVYALAHTTPTRVTNAITLNPVLAAIVATFVLGEPFGLDLLIGIAAVFAGILIASTDGSSAAAPSWSVRRSRFATGWSAWRQLVASRHHLAKLNDHELRDVGLGRGEARREDAWIQLRRPGNGERPDLDGLNDHYLKDIGARR